MGSKEVNEFVNEDTVKCFLYSMSAQPSHGYWEKTCETVNNMIKGLSVDYIWHRDEFTMSVPLYNEVTDESLMHLVGETCFGDNIEDEWFIIYLILEITKAYKDIIAQVIDNDGEFLLIEAADYLPSWANPESTENRVFIYNGNIHLISECIDVDSKLGVKDAIQMLVDQPEKTMASTQIQDAILNRVKGYPEKIKDFHHRAVMKLPVDIATVLTLKPSLIAPIVTAYCNHDVLDEKLCRNISYNNCVDIEIKFTKCLYAMLMHSKIINFARKMNISESDKKSVCGFRLTCGYYILMGNSSDNLFLSKEYQKYLASLKTNGYFKENIEGSKGYTQLLEKANNYFVQMECPITSHVAHNIKNLISTPDFENTKELLEHRHGTNLVEDSDDWLIIQPQQLNDLLDKRYGKTAKLSNDDIITPESVRSKLSNFLKQTSDFEGIEQTEDKQESEQINFDSEEFVNSIEKMLSILACDNNNDDECSDSEIDEDLENSQEDISFAMEKELAGKLISVDGDKQNLVVGNIMKSIKEEGGASGPSSNLLKTIGIHKSDLLDSDDDE